MKIDKIETVGGAPVALISGSEAVIEDVHSALDLMATVRYETECDRVAIPKALLAEPFFDLKTRLAGEILQKYVNYQMKLAIFGDFSGYESKSLRDFIYECNKGSYIFFLDTAEQAVERLSAAR